MNVGATTVAGSYKTCYGDYFAWGEATPRYASITRTSASDASFTWKSDYSSGYSSSKYPSYTDNTLDAEHDAATANWGGSWRTPTLAEFNALMKACSSSDNNKQTPVELTGTIVSGGIYWLSSTQAIEPFYTGSAGLLFVSASDISKRIFFPAAGNVYNKTLNGERGIYWSSTYYNTPSAYSLWFYSSSVHPDYNARFNGFSIRPVSD